MSDATGGFVKQIALSLGSTDDAIRLILTLLIAYPLALIHRVFLHNQRPVWHHLFFSVCGIYLIYFNFGTDVVHSLANVLIVYSVLYLAGGTLLSIALIFVVNMTYLTLAYYLTSTDGYDIKWSTPHCVLCLRLIGLAFDVYDGTKKKENLSEEQKSSALPQVPSILEIMGYTYYFGGFMVGPQFPLSKYMCFVNGEYDEFVRPGNSSSLLSQCVREGFYRLIVGILYLGLFQLAHMYIPTEYLVSHDYAQMALWKKLLYLGLWCKVYMYKYISVFIMAEGSCIMTGLTYNGKDENGNILWDGCRNIYLRRYEMATTFRELISSFNVNTNKWMAKYIFKRLKFLGNKDISQGVTLFYLAWWHGILSGYYVNFSIEFFIMKLENDVTAIMKKRPWLSNITRLSFPFNWVLCKVWTCIFLGYPLSSFVLLSYERWFKLYSSIYFTGHIIFCGWFLVYPVIQRMQFKNSDVHTSQKKE